MSTLPDFPRDGRVSALLFPDGAGVPAMQLTLGNVTQIVRGFVIPLSPEMARSWIRKVKSAVSKAEFTDPAYDDFIEVRVLAQHEPLWILREVIRTCTAIVPIMVQVQSGIQLATPADVPGGLRA